MNSFQHFSTAFTSTLVTPKVKFEYNKNQFFTPIKITNVMTLQIMTSRRKFSQHLQRKCRKMSTLNPFFPFVVLLHFEAKFHRRQIDIAVIRWHFLQKWFFKSHERKALKTKIRISHNFPVFRLNPHFSSELQQFMEIKFVSRINFCLLFFAPWRKICGKNWIALKKSLKFQTNFFPIDKSLGWLLLCRIKSGESIHYLVQ